MEKNIYRSKCGDIFWLPILTVSVIMAIGAYTSFLWYLFIVVEIAFLLIMVYTWTATRYVFDEEMLSIRMPLMMEDHHIKYDSVECVIFPGRVAGVHGCSRISVAIYYDRRGSVSVSPSKMEDFLLDLRERCPKAAFEIKS